MKITPFGIILAVVAITAILYIFWRLRQDLLGVRSAVVWLILWVFIGVFSLFPDLLNVVMQLVRMENRMFFVLLCAVLVLFALQFNASAKIDRMDRNIAKIIQELAIVNGDSGDGHDFPPTDNDR